jgi:pimeloyl-ACP methyl ester carboxylesterase
VRDRAIARPPRVVANKITMNYDQQGTGEPLVLIPYLAADHACYAFQVPEYARHFTCFSVDLRGTGDSDKPTSAYTTALLADDVAGFLQAVGIEKAHVAGLSLGGAVGMWLAAKYPGKVASLPVHSGWAKTDAFLRTLVEGWQMLAKAAGVQEMMIRAIFPWCFTPELYAQRPDYIELFVFDGCAHAALYVNVAEFNQRTLAFMQRHAGAAVA